MSATQSSSPGRSVTNLSETPACCSASMLQKTGWPGWPCPIHGNSASRRASALAFTPDLSSSASADAKRQIAYFGDTMNVAARLCDQCKTAEEALLVSADLLRAAAVPLWLCVGTPADIALRGRKAPVETHAVRRDAGTGSMAA